MGGKAEGKLRSGLGSSHLLKKALKHSKRNRKKIRCKGNGMTGRYYGR